MDEPALADELGFANRLADIAREITLGGFGERQDPELKADETPVTAADREAERAIRRAIAERFPADGVLGEEVGLQEGTSGRLWVIDPIDGTRLYAEGIPLWSTLIGLQIGGAPVMGVADVPVWNQRFHAVRGRGAWRGDRRLSVSGIQTLKGSTVAHSSIEDWIAGGRYEALLRTVRGSRATRGICDAIGQLLVAQGSMEAMLEHEPCQIWDWTATSVIVAEAGGRMTTIDGSEPTPGCDLLVTNGKVHDELLGLLAEGSEEA